MFEFIRNYKKWLLLFLLVCIFPSFILASFYNLSESEDKKKDLVVIGKYAITLNDFKDTYAKVIKKIEYDLGDQFNEKEIDTINFRIKILNDMIKDKLLSIVAHDYNFQVSEDYLRNAINAIDWGNGPNKFSFEKYINFLSSKGIDPCTFENYYRDRLSAEQLLNNITLSSKLPNILSSIYYKWYFQKRFVKIINFRADDYKNNYKFTKKNMKDWYDLHSEKLRIPENIDLECILLNTTCISKDIKVNDSEVLSFYSHNKNKFIYPEIRKINYLSINFQPNTSRSVKTDILNKINTKIKNKVDSLISLQKEINNIKNEYIIGTSLSSNNWHEENCIKNFNHEIRDKIFTLKSKDMSDAIEFMNNFYVFEIDEIIPEKILDFKDVKKRIFDQIYSEKQKMLFLEKYNELCKDIYNIPLFQDVSNKLNLEYHKLYGITKTGDIINSDVIMNHYIDNDLYENITKNHNVLQNLFNNDDFLKGKINSGLIKISPNVFVVLKTVKHNQSYVPSFLNSENRIHSILLEKYALEKATEHGEEILNKLKHNKEKAENVNFSKTIEVSRNMESNFLSKDIIDFIMNIPLADIPGYFNKVLDNSFILIKIDKIEEPKSDIVLEKEMNLFLSNMYGDAEASAIFHNFCDKYRVRILESTKNLLNSQKF